MLNIYLKVTIERNWCSQSFNFLNLPNLSLGQFQSLHPHLDDGESFNHFSEDLYRRDVGQIRILDGNWQFIFGNFFQVGLENFLYKNCHFESETKKKDFCCFSLLVPYPKNNSNLFYLKIWVKFQYCLGVTPWKCKWCFIWTLKMCLLLFDGNSLKVRGLFDMNSENVFSLD